jgi:homopolymeric O-antigen transport system permease protein
MGVSSSPRRPTVLVSLILDGILGVLAYLLAYWLRFDRDRLITFLPGVWSTLPFVLTGQLGALALVAAYGTHPRVDWLMRLAIGGVAGTAIGAVVVGLTLGFAGISRSAFVADAMLFTFCAFAWRAGWVLRARTRASTDVTTGPLVDRAEEVAPLKSVVVNLYQYRELLKNLVTKDLKLKYRGSVFGFLWSLTNPLLMIAVYTFAFTYIMQIRSVRFVFYLMLGQLSWSFFASSASMSTGSIVDNGGLLKSVLFPRAILPIGTVLFNLAQFLLTLAVFLPAMMLWYRVPLSATMLVFPVFLMLQVVFTIGVALALSTWTAFFRDVRHLLEVALAMLFWLTPIIYELSSVPERFRLLILLGPMSPFVIAYEQIFFYRHWPDPTVWAIAVTHALGAFVIGSLVFVAFEPQFTEQL